jgi:predicted RNA-binding Zn ribbon-like protein
MRVTTYTVAGFATLNDDVKFVASNRPMDAYRYSLEHSARKNVRIWELPSAMNKDDAKKWILDNVADISDMEKKALEIPATKSSAKTAAPVAPVIVKTPEEIEAERIAKENEEIARAAAVAAEIAKKKEALAATKTAMVAAAAKKAKKKAPAEKSAAPLDEKVVSDIVPDTETAAA